MPRKLSKKEQMDSMQNTAAQGQDLMTSLRNNFSGDQIDPSMADRFKVDDVNKDQQDYAKAMQMVKQNNPTQTQDPMMELMKRRAQPQPQFQQQMTDQDAAAMANQFEPSPEDQQKLELKRKLLNSINNR